MHYLIAVNWLLVALSGRFFFYLQVAYLQLNRGFIVLTRSMLRCSQPPLHHDCLPPLPHEFN